MAKPIEFKQQTFEFNNVKAAIHFIAKMRRRFGTDAKFFLKSTASKSYVKARFPDLGELMDYKLEAMLHRAMKVNSHIWT